MKKIVILLVSILCVLCSNAQVKNSNGEKVVRKVEVCFEDSEKPYIIVLFNYNNVLELEEIAFNALETCKIFWKKDKNGVKRVEYDENNFLREDLVYSYTIENGLIDNCKIDNINIVGGVLRYDYYYQYDNQKRLLSSNKFAYFKEKNQQFKELSDRYREIFEWDDENNVYTTQEWGWQWKIGQIFDHSVQYSERKYYPDLHNETNIDLSGLFNAVKNYDRFEMVTEWFGRHSEHLIENNCGYFYEYVYGDDFGNITEINVYNPNSVLEKTIKIHYWK